MSSATYPAAAEAAVSYPTRFCCTSNESRFHVTAHNTTAPHGIRSLAVILVSRSTRARVGPRYTPTSECKFRYLTTSSDSPEILRERESEKDKEIEIKRKRKRERGRGREKEREESSTRTVVLALLPILRNRLFLRRSLT